MPGSPANARIPSHPSAAENRRIGFVNHGMDENILPEPGMKRVQNLPLNGPVGLFKSGCKIANGLTPPMAGNRLAWSIGRPFNPTSRRRK
jgi:hypothetical protein